MTELYKNYLTPSQKQYKIMGIPEEKEREKKMERLSKQIIDKNFLKPWKELAPHIQEANTTFNCLNPKRPCLRHTILKLPKIKNMERILKANRGKYSTYKGKSIRLLSDFSE